MVERAVWLSFYILFCGNTSRYTIDHPHFISFAKEENPKTPVMIYMKELNNKPHMFINVR